jgi:hypothetical protein
MTDSAAAKKVLSRRNELHAKLVVLGSPIVLVAASYMISGAVYQARASTIRPAGHSQIDLDSKPTSRVRNHGVLPGTQACKD